MNVIVIWGRVYKPANSEPRAFILREYTTDSDGTELERWVYCLDENEILSEIRSGLFMGVVGHVKLHSGRKVLVLDRFTDPSYPHDRS